MRIVQKFVSSDAETTTKYLLELRDGSTIEATHVNRPEKHIICFSSQIGCKMRCIFCATKYCANEGNVRSLTKEEMIAECVIVIRDAAIGKSLKPILFSCMGTGEPLLNYRNVIDTLVFLGRSYGGAKLALSTLAHSPRLLSLLATEVLPAKLKLQISLHAPNDKLRQRISPHATPINEILPVAISLSGYERFDVEWNYVLIDGMNDDRDCANELACILPPKSCVKLNGLNNIGDPTLRRPPKETVDDFARILENAGHIVERYQTNGGDIWAACGQLTAQFHTTKH